MDAAEIRRLVSKSKMLSHVFRGVYPKMTFPLRVDPPWGAVLMNTRERGSLGEHWVCYFTPEKDEELTIFFDPRGKSPEEWNMKFRGQLMLYNDVPVQPRGSIFCGLYCLLFVYMKARGCSLWDILDIFHHEQLESNERIVLNFASKLNTEQLE